MDFWILHGISGGGRLRLKHSRRNEISPRRDEIVARYGTPCQRHKDDSATSLKQPKVILLTDIQPSLNSSGTFQAVQNLHTGKMEDLIP